MCMCLAGAAYEERGRVDEWIGVGLYQSCGNGVSVVRLSMFGLWWYGWCRWVVGRGLDQCLEGRGGVMPV